MTKPQAIVDKIRAERAALVAELDALETAPPPVAEIIARVGAWCDHHSVAFEQRLFKSVGAFKTPAVTAIQDIFAETTLVPASGGCVDVPLAPVLCWLAGPEIKARLQTIAEQATNDEGAIPTAGRAERRIEIEDRIRVLELEEERAIRASGNVIARRADADVRFALMTDAALANAA